MRRPFLLLLLGCVSIDTWPQSPPAPSQTPLTITASASPSAVAPLTLAQVLDLAHRSNPTLLAGAQHLSAVRAQEITAGLRQNPSGIVGGQLIMLWPDNRYGPDFYNAGASRLFERGHKREIRLENARLTTSVVDFQLDDQRRQTDLAVRQAFSHMLYVQAAFDISGENLEGYRKTVALMKVRLDAGDIDQTDFDRVDLQLAGFESVSRY